MANDPPKPAAEPEGIRCPKCHCLYTRVYYTRKMKGINRRVRICGSPICGHKFATKESVTGNG